MVEVGGRVVAVSVVGVGRGAVWVAAVVEGEALVVTSTLGMVVVMTSLPRTQRMQSQSIAKLVLLPSTCVPVFDVVIGLINIIVLEYVLEHYNIKPITTSNTGTQVLGSKTS